MTALLHSLQSLLGALGPLEPWQALISFRAPEPVQKELINHTPDWFIHKLEDAFGNINLDYYPVTVTRLPDFAPTPEALLTTIRTEFDRFIDTRLASFSPYDESHRIRWRSTNPVGAVVHIDMRLGGELKNPDDGSVVCVEHASDHWIFSTLWTPHDFSHPVSGNRQWGFTRNADGSFTFYTRGADRTTVLLDHIISKTVFAGAHQLWTSLQQGIVREVLEGKGAATVGAPISARHNWETVKANLWRPTRPWLFE